MQIITKNYHQLGKLDTNKILKNLYLQNDQNVTETGAFMYRGTVRVQFYILLGQVQWWAKLLRLLTVNSLSYFVKIKY